MLILHGWGSRKEKWKKVAEILSKKGHRVIIPDLPGFGESEKPGSVWGIEEYSSFVNDLAGNLGLNAFDLLGHSFGGALAAKYAIEHPEKIIRLFLAGAACIRGEKKKKSFLKFLKIFKHIPLAKRFFYRFIVKSDYPQTDGRMREIYLKVIMQDLTDELEKISIPATVIWGEKDDITPLRQGRIINSKIKNSKLFIILNHGHALQLTAPEELCSHI